MKNVLLLLLPLFLAACASESVNSPNEPTLNPRVGDEGQFQKFSDEQVDLGVIQTNPGGSMVLVNDVCIGVTPMSDLKLNQFDKVELYNAGYCPISFTVNGNVLPKCTFELTPTNQRLFQLLSGNNVRFVYRPDGLKLEPANLPVYTNCAFIASDPSVGRDIQLTVEKITGHYVILRANDGNTLVYPITRAAPQNPGFVKNTPPTSSPYQATSYGNAAMNVNAMTMPQYNNIPRQPVATQF